LKEEIQKLKESNQKLSEQHEQDLIKIQELTEQITTNDINVRVTLDTSTSRHNDDSNDDELIKQCINTLFEKSSSKKLATRLIFDKIYTYVTNNYPDLKERIQIEDPEEENGKASMGYSSFFNRVIRTNLKNLGFKIFSAKNKGEKSGYFCKNK
jgi:hypothetical protein